MADWRDRIDVLALSLELPRRRIPQENSNRTRRQAKLPCPRRAWEDFKTVKAGRRQPSRGLRSVLSAVDALPQSNSTNSTSDALRDITANVTTVPPTTTTALETPETTAVQPVTETPPPTTRIVKEELTLAPTTIPVTTLPPTT
ncbi:hypothetical protein AC1031_002089 [Aphanomyces cochlioides]|nr:hypothetical protein AC1031_002089 [Aphanomyces cochlioides]